MKDIQNCSSFFHDGSIMDIIHNKNGVVFLIESAEVEKGDVGEGTKLSINNTIRGKLHIDKIRSIKRDNKRFSGKLRMEHEDAEIFHFKIIENHLAVQIKRNSFPPKPCIEDFSTIEIEAEKIWWENIPDLEIAVSKKQNRH